MFCRDKSIRAGLFQIFICRFNQYAMMPKNLQDLRFRFTKTCLFPVVKNGAVQPRVGKIDRLDSDLFKVSEALRPVFRGGTQLVHVNEDIAVVDAANK